MQRNYFISSTNKETSKPGSYRHPGTLLDLYESEALEQANTDPGPRLWERVKDTKHGTQNYNPKEILF